MLSKIFERCNTGWLKNKIDIRDFELDKYKDKKIKRNTYDLSFYLPEKTLYQGSIPSCVAHGIANQIFIEEMIKSSVKKGKPISRLYLYYYARFLENYKTPNSEGAYPRLAYKALQKIGCPYEHRWPYKTNRVNEKPNYEAVRGAMTLNKMRYYWLDKDPDQIRSVLCDNHPITIGTEVTQDFKNYKSGSGKILMAPSSNDKLLGGHYMCIVGFAKDYFIVANSWHGREIILMHEDWITKSFTSDLGVIVL